MFGLTFVELMALLDPPREAVPDAVATCQTAEVEIIMVTSDHPATAKSIVRQVNITEELIAEDIAKERGILLVLRSWSIDYIPSIDYLYQATISLLWSHTPTSENLNLLPNA